MDDLILGEIQKILKNQNKERREIFKRQVAWDKKHMATCSCRLKKEDYFKFKNLCYSVGSTPHAVLRLMVGILIESSGNGASKNLKKDVRIAGKALQYVDSTE